MTSETVLEIAELIRDKAEVIVNADIEADMVEAFDQIEAAVKRARAIL